MTAEQKAEMKQFASESVDYTKKMSQLHTEQDYQLWAIVEDVPYMTGIAPYFIFLLNFFLPGSGTMLSACIGYTGAWSKTQLFVGCLQMMTAVFIFGWLWSIWWGIKIVSKSRAGQSEEHMKLNHEKSSSAGSTNYSAKQ